MEPQWLIPLAVVLVLAAFAVSWLLVRRRRPAVVVPAGPPAGGLWQGLMATRRRLGEQLESALRASAPADVVLESLEEALISADVGLRTTQDLVAGVRRRLGSSASSAEIRSALRLEIENALGEVPLPALDQRPWVVLIAGVNGVGKTTTIGRLAALHRAAGRRVLMVAADTFRAAAVEQLAVWAERTGADLVRQAEGADPSAVVFDGLKAARARGIDVVLIDTAGRLHTRTNLMEELAKIRRVAAREIPEAPHETLLVLDATTGQNAVAQARTFGEALAVTGVVLTKLDGTARGGVVVAVRRELGVPVRYVGVGEGVDDLRAFDPHEFAEALLAPAPEEAAGAANP